MKPGVSASLARARAAAGGGVRYDLSLRVPADPAAPVDGSLRARFELRSREPVAFDFSAPGSALRSVVVNGHAIDAAVAHEHVIIDERWLSPGINEVGFEFIAGSAPLNRQQDFLYSLFVPARARFTFPCFDQPDLKARFSLTLDVPASWQAVSNTPVVSSVVASGRRRLRFAATEPLPTYLFSFAAGVLELDEGTRSGRRFRVWHRERERRLVPANLEAILDLHARALSWVEGYTGVAYPFSQFDVVLVPSFQFSGMEHPGAVLYNASRLLLESSASEQDHLTRAALIAHETAHMWFGDLVTMKWFDDVWLKEVFANFVAEKIVADVFPGQDHALRFFLANHPSAYAVDRSEGANAIRQGLDNLAHAGQLYGPIIYLKSPIVLRHLEMRLGERVFRERVRGFLQEFRFANADWHDLRRHLASNGDVDLERWSALWMDEAGRPRVRAERQVDANGRLAGLVVCSEDPAGRARVWPQMVNVAVGSAGRSTFVPAEVDAPQVRVDAHVAAADFLVPGGDGVGYAQFVLDPDSRAWLLAHIAEIDRGVTRAVAWESLWDALLEGQLAAAEWLHAGLAAVTREADEQNISRMTATLNRAFWQFLTSTERASAGAAVEGCLLHGLERAPTATARATWFAALRQMTTTHEGCQRLERVWRRVEPLPGLTLGESDETALALDLALREHIDAREAVQVQLQRTHDEERRARLQFLAPGVSPRAGEREAAFGHLAAPEQRAREPWALTLLQYLNHPLRQAHARRFIEPGLALLPEITRTGDIFFPARWADALLGGHSSPAAAVLVRRFLANHHDLPSPLRRAVLVAADLLFRAADGSPQPVH